jgi:undecaprenyl-diphosphatase
VLIPALVGGSWAQDLSVSRPESPYLAFMVGLHVATATAMIIYFRHDWARIVTGFVSSLRDRTIATAEQKLAWMIVLATIPVGLSGLALEHTFRVVFSKPVPTALFLTLNGVILLAGERARRRSGERAGEHQPVAAPATPQPAVTAAGHPGQSPRRYPASPLSGPRQPPVQQPADGPETAEDRRLAGMGYGKAIVIGAVQVFALLPGISRDGMATVTGMFRGLSREDAVRYSFLLSAPVILAAGALKIPDLFGPGRRHPRPGPGRQPAVRPRCLLLGPVPGPLFQQGPVPRPLRHLLPDRGPGQRRLVRHPLITQAGRLGVRPAEHAGQDAGHALGRGARRVRGAPGDEAVRPDEDRAVRGDPVGGTEARVRVREITGRLLPGLPVGHLVGVEPDAQRARRVACQVAPGGAARARQQDEVPAEQVERGQPRAPTAQEDVRRSRAWLARAVARVLVRRPAVARFGDDGG